MAVDWFLEQKGISRHLMSEAVSVIGHSMEGYTALAAAGGIPASFPQESADGQSRTIAVTPDRRIHSLVLLSPAAVWFRREGALRSVDLPILLLNAEHDPYTPSFHADIIIGGVADPRKIQYRTVENAGHFSFLSPYPKSMITPAFLPSQDPPGFDREQFHQRLNDEILHFLRSHHTLA